jgi:hypothetical protein
MKDAIAAARAADRDEDPTEIDNAMLIFISGGAGLRIDDNGRC